MSFGSVDAFLGDKVAYRLSDASLSKLASNKSVYAVLKIVDLLISRYFGLVKVAC